MPAHDWNSLLRECLQEFPSEISETPHRVITEEEVDKSTLRAFYLTLVVRLLSFIWGTARK